MNTINQINNTNKLLLSPTNFKAKKLTPTIQSNLTKKVPETTIKTGKLLKKIITTSALALASMLGLISNTSSKKTDKLDINNQEIMQMISECKNNDDTYNVKKLNKIYKQIYKLTPKDNESNTVIKLLNAFGDIDKLTNNYPEFSESLAHFIEIDSFNDKNVRKYIKEGLSTGNISKKDLDKYKTFINSELKLENDNFIDMHNSAYTYNILSSVDNFKNYTQESKKIVLHSIKNQLIKHKGKLYEEIFVQIIDCLPEDKLSEIFDNKNDFSTKFDNMGIESETMLYKYFSKMFKQDDLSEKDVDTLIAVTIRLFMMKKLYSENFESLTNSTIFKYDFALSKEYLPILASIDITQNYNDKKLKKLIKEMKEKNKPKEKNIDFEQNSKILNYYINEHGLDNDQINEITGYIQNAKDKDFLNNTIEKYKLPFEQDVIVDYIKYLSQEPEFIKKIIEYRPDYPFKLIEESLKLNQKINNTEFIKKLYDKFFINDFLEDILKNVNNNNVAIISNYFDSQENINYTSLRKLLALKNIPQLKDKSQWDNILSTFDEVLNDFSSEESKFDLKELRRYSKITELKLNHPEKYEKIKESGIFELLNNKRIKNSFLRCITNNSDLTPNLYDDLEKIKNNESIVTEFPEGTALDCVFAKTKCGDIAEIGTKLYINDGKKMCEWKMSKEKFLELFPTALRFMTTQGNVGNCYLISTLDRLMQNPNGRAELYKLFEQDGNDILVTIKAYKEYGGTTRFKDSKLPYSDSGKNDHVLGCLGIKMLELAFAKTTFRQDADTAFVKDGTNYSEIIERTVAGSIDDTIEELLEINITKADKIPDKTNNMIYNIDFNTSKNKLTEIENILTKYANEKDIIIQFGTNADIADKEKFKKEYNIGKKHAHAVTGYDTKTKTVKVVNPHSCCLESNIPIDEFCKICDHFYITKF